MSAASAPNVPDGGAEHEFTEAENAVLRGFASAAVSWGVLSAIAALACVSALVAGAVGVHRGGPRAFFAAAAFIEATLAVSFIGAGRAFLLAVRTEGSDITHVMRAVRFLAGAFLVQICVAGALILLALAAFGAGLLG